MRASKFAVSALLLLCVSCKTLEPFVVSGKALNEVGVQFVAVAEAMEKLHNDGFVSDVDFAKFRMFGLKFQQSYPAAVQLWRIAVLTNDRLLEGQVSQLIVDLINQLQEFSELVIKITGKPAPEVKDGE